MGRIRDRGGCRRKSGKGIGTDPGRRGVNGERVVWNIKVRTYRWTGPCEGEPTGLVEVKRYRLCLKS